MTILTSNLDLPAWYDLFKTKPPVDALLDRLRHHCVTIRIVNLSLRRSASDPRLSPKSRGHVRHD
jgi:DNA replication protein DnaC